jgi:hypothetical protein
LGVAPAAALQKMRHAFPGIGIGLPWPDCWKRHEPVSFIKALKILAASFNHFVETGGIGN